jgi:hypothetical protein
MKSKQKGKTNVSVLWLILYIYFHYKKTFNFLLSKTTIVLF